MSLKDFITAMVCTAVTAVWLAAGMVSLVTDRAQVFLIASGPMAAIVTFATGISIARKVPKK